MKRFLLSIFLTTKLFCATEMIIFSYDRAMQLDLLLYSIDKKIDKLDHITVITRTTQGRHKKSYEEIEKRFAHLPISFCYQNKANFKELTMSAMKSTKCDHILFAVDDIVVTDKVDLSICEKALARNKNALGVYLRMGKNISKKFNGGRMRKPKLRSVKLGLFIYHFRSRADYWNYPHTVDMTLFRKNEAIALFEPLDFKAPNSMEGEAAKVLPIKKYGLCFARSKAVNVPANAVRKEIGAPTFKSADVKMLLDLFEKGKKIKYAPFDLYLNHCPHENINYVYSKDHE